MCRSNFFGIDHDAESAVSIREASVCEAAVFGFFDSVIVIESMDVWGLVCEWEWTRNWNLQAPVEPKVGDAMLGFGEANLGCIG